ncbi:hypothetical protein C84B14_03261 [Salinisphaera sp. C84B14]|uniref:hypothetical protein n=1 Tax=Salinisphaera sp. C84B14 TaxID=1304155 RepID=UPI0033409528
MSEQQAMRDQPRWQLAALIPLAVGLFWLASGWGHAWAVAIPAAFAGVPILGCGTAIALWPGDRQITQYLALGALVSAPIAVLLSPWLGWSALVLLVGAVACFLVAGWVATLESVRPAAVPQPPLSLGVCRKVATDEALLGLFVAGARIPRGAVVKRDYNELLALQAVAENGYWANGAQHWHRTPHAPADFRLLPTRSRGCEFEWLYFDSEFEADPALPGAARWEGHRPNQNMAARIFRHAGAPRPWLICIHGYRMGIDGLDLSLFRAKRLHLKFGMNVAMPILPLHGSRSIARVTGGEFLDGPMADLIHAQAQGLWDLRRLKAWIQADQPDQPVGALGYSLGGYHAALLAAFEADLACVIAGIPLTDIPAALWAHMPTLHLRFLEAQGLSQGALSELMAPVSPLHLDPLVPKERRYIFAATADQLVAPDQPLRLWRHWDEPAMHWYHGSHLSVRREAELLPFVENALARHGLIHDDKRPAE